MVNRYHQVFPRQQKAAIIEVCEFPCLTKKILVDILFSNIISIIIIKTGIKKQALFSTTSGDPIGVASNLFVRFLLLMVS